MPDLTRRRALLTVVSGITGLAGCTGSESERPTIDRRENERPVTDYEVRHVRNDEGAVLFSTREEIPKVTDDEQSRFVRSSRGVIVSEERFAEFTFGDVPEAEQLRSFATATDFETSSLYLLAMPVEACYEIRLQTVAVDWDGQKGADLHPFADFCRTYRPADVACRVDDIHTVGIAIRLPIAADRSSGAGRGMGGSCDHSSRGAYFNATVTPAGGGTDQ